MTYKKQVINVGMMTICLIPNLVGWSNNPPYKNAAFNNAHIEIRQKAIDLSTSEVARRADTETDVAKSFKEYFLTDVPEDTPISEKRKIQRSMKLIRLARNKEEISGLTLEVNEFAEDIALEFQDKEESIEKEIKGLWGKRVGYGLLLVTGVVLLGVASSQSKDLGLVMGIPGGIATITGGAGSYSVRGKKELLKIHKVQMQTMKNDWEDAFKIK